VIDFEIPAEAKVIRERARTFVQEAVLPVEEEGLRTGRSPRDILPELRPKAKEAGLWCPHMPKEWGGMGLSPLENALMQMELGMSRLGPAAVNSEGPDDATMLTLLEHGTAEQKRKYLPPLVNGEWRVAFSMTERAAGADATGMQTRAVRDGDNWILNGEKWFSSGASGASLAVIVAKTDPDAPRHRQFSQFIVELPNPGYQIVRDIPTMASGPGRDGGGGHAEVIIKDLVVPAANMLGGEGDGFSLGQHRLGYGRLRHGMRNVAMAQRALDMAAKRALERSTFGTPLAERQGIQWMLADCASELYIARLMVLHIAYKMEHHLDMRQENSIAKVFLANMVHKVVDTALQIHGALGYTHDTPLAGWYTSIRAQRLVDGPDEVHRWTVGRNLLRAYREHGTTAPACGGDLL
jgi:acyl-CoA dehydrogenase